MNFYKLSLFFNIYSNLPYKGARHYIQTVKGVNITYKGVLVYIFQIIKQVSIKIEKMGRTNVISLNF